jgi:hypothetical protein
MAKLKEMEAAMNEYFKARSEAAGSGLVVLPGVVELLRALQVVQSENPAAVMENPAAVLGRLVHMHRCRIPAGQAAAYG